MRKKTIEPETISKTRQKLNEEGVYCEKVKRYVKKQPTEQEIIKRLSGVDETGGSCSSLAFAYTGNKNGYNVTDFRGGKSRELFSKKVNVTEIANFPGVKSTIVRESDDFEAVKKLLEKVEDGKEYYLGTGSHAAIIRKSGEGYEYLELQSKRKKGNGFKPLTERKLESRFKCQHSNVNEDGSAKQLSSHLIECESLGQSEEFQNLLGYINTLKDYQLKG